MADRITDEAFDAMPLSQQLEFVASHLHEADEASFAALKSWDISTMLMHCLVMSRKAAALERELQQWRDDERLQVLRLEFAFEQAEAPDSNVVNWPVIPRNERMVKNLSFTLQDFVGRHPNCHETDTPKGAA